MLVAGGQRRPLEANEHGASSVNKDTWRRSVLHAAICQNLCSDRREENLLFKFGQVREIHQHSVQHPELLTHKKSFEKSDFLIANPKVAVRVSPEEVAPGRRGTNRWPAS